MLTFVENVAHWGIVDNHHLAQIRLDLTEILDVCAVPLRAMLSIVAGGKVLALQLQPVYHGIGIFLYRCSKDNQVVPLRHLH